MADRTNVAPENDSEVPKPNAESPAEFQLNPVIMSKLIRMVLSRTSANLDLRSDHFSPSSEDPGPAGTLRQRMDAVRERLEKIYGLTLVQAGTEVHVISCLPERTEKFLTFASNLKSCREKNNGKPDEWLVSIPSEEEELSGATRAAIVMTVMRKNSISGEDLVEALFEYHTCSEPDADRQELLVHYRTVLDKILETGFLQVSKIWKKCKIHLFILWANVAAKKSVPSVFTR